MTMFDYSLDRVIETAANDIDRIALDATQTAEHLAQADFYTSEFKAKEVARLADEKSQAIRSTAQPVLEQVQKRIAELEAITRPSVVPSLAEAQQLTYARDALAARWAVLDSNGMIEEWRAALVAGDTVTARVYRDFAPVAFREKGVTVGDSTEKTIPIPIRSAMADLSDQTNRALMTPDQIKAVERLTDLRAKHASLISAAAQANRIASLHYRGGKVVERTILHTPVSI